MSDTSQSVMLQIVALPNGRYSVIGIGETAMDNDEGAFATRDEAEDWMFRRTQMLDAQANELDIIVPGSGQALR